MLTEIHAADGLLSPGMRACAVRYVVSAFQTYRHRVRRIRIFLADASGRPGRVERDLSIAVELRPSGRVVVSARDSNIFVALAEVVSRSREAVRVDLGHRSPRRRRSIRRRGGSRAGPPRKVPP